MGMLIVLAVNKVLLSHCKLFPVGTRNSPESAMHSIKSEYHQQHKEEKKEYDKIYRENNKDRKRENDTVYREKNRDKLLAKIECACGNTYAHKNKSRHERSNKHQEYLKAVAED